jgi:hypothetical protein
LQPKRKRCINEGATGNFSQDFRLAIRNVDFAQNRVRRRSIAANSVEQCFGFAYDTGTLGIVDVVNRPVRDLTLLALTRLPGLEPTSNSGNVGGVPIATVPCRTRGWRAGAALLQPFL